MIYLSSVVDFPVLFVLSDSDQKQQMPFHSPQHVPALYIYPTTQGIFTISDLLCECIVM